MLGALLASVELFEEDHSPADWQKHQRRIGSSARSLQDMVANLLDLSLADRADPTLRQELPQLRKLPARYVVWGDGSSDEMCLGLVQTVNGVYHP